MPNVAHGDTRDVTPPPGHFSPGMPPIDPNQPPQVMVVGPQGQQPIHTVPAQMLPPHLQAVAAQQRELHKQYEQRRKQKLLKQKLKKKNEKLSRKRVKK